MGMGYFSNYADVMEESYLHKLCPKEYTNFKNALASYKWELEDWAKYLNDVTELDLPDNLTEEGAFKEAIKFTERCWSDLRNAFCKATAIGKSNLYIDLDYHSPEDGDRYDDVSGAFFVVGGVYELTPAGKKFKNAINRKFYVTFG